MSEMPIPEWGRPETQIADTPEEAVVDYSLLEARLQTIAAEPPANIAEVFSTLLLSPDVEVARLAIDFVPEALHACAESGLVDAKDLDLIRDSWGHAMTRDDVGYEAQEVFFLTEKRIAREDPVTHARIGWLVAREWFDGWDGASPTAKNS